MIRHNLKGLPSFNSALPGYPPARDLIVRNYLHSPAVQASLWVQDAVRFTVAFVPQGALASSEAAEVAIVLGNYFSRRGAPTRRAFVLRSSRQSQRNSA